MAPKVYVNVVAGALGVYAATKVVPALYHWELIPGVSSPAYYEKAARMKYDNYNRGIVYDSYDTGVDTRTTMDPASEGRIKARTIRH